MGMMEWHWYMVINRHLLLALIVEHMSFWIGLVIGMAIRAKVGMFQVFLLPPGWHDGAEHLLVEFIGYSQIE